MITELIRTWESEAFKLEIFDTDVVQERYAQHFPRRNYLGYKFYHEGKLIFEGEDFGVSCMDSDDGDATVAGILYFLSLMPGDTDREYFLNYTDEQREWRDSHAEQVKTLALELEESDDE